MEKCAESVRLGKRESPGEGGLFAVEKDPSAFHLIKVS